MKKFAIIGVGGYIAPRHLKAIKDTGNNLVSAYDKNDSVGIMDSYFPKAAFFTEQELFDRHNTKLKDQGIQIDYVSVCTPNYLHDAHTRYALRLGADVICEKPLVLNPWNIDALHNVEERTGHKAYTILQLRLHDKIAALKKKVEEGPKDKIYDIDLTYITSRGNWYYASWKGNINKSGGVATNIGVHFYDMLSWIFGAVKKNIVHVATHDRVAGYLELEKARVRYFLSINGDTLPPNAVQGEKRTYRTLNIDGEELLEKYDNIKVTSTDKGSASKKPANASRSSMRSVTPNRLASWATIIQWPDWNAHRIPSEEPINQLITNYVSDRLH